MNKQYFYASIFFTAISLVSFYIGILYGFTAEAFYLLKPITVFQYSVFLAFASYITSIKERIRKSRMEVFIVIGFLIAMASFYEILFNYFFWFAQYTQYGFTNLDLIRNTVPYATNITLIISAKDVEQLAKAGLYPVSLNVASKISTLVFFCSLYLLYLIFDVKRMEIKGDVR